MACCSRQSEIKRTLVGSPWSHFTCKAIASGPADGADRAGGNPLGRGRILEFLLVSVVVGSCPWVSNRVSYPRGPLLDSVFLRLCLCRQKPPCIVPVGSVILWQCIILGPSVAEFERRDACCPTLGQQMCVIICICKTCRPISPPIEG